MNFTVVGNGTGSYDRPVTGRRPGSAKPQTTRNPITGEETPVRVQSRTKNAPPRASRKPQGIPGLDLKYLKDTDDYMCLPLEVCDYPLTSAGDSARTDISWGTAPSTQRSERFSSRPNTVRDDKDKNQSFTMPSLALKDEDYHVSDAKLMTPRSKKMTAWDKPAIPDPENCPPPSDRHRKMYKDHLEDMKSSYRSKNKHELTEDEINEAIEEIRERHPDLHVNVEDIIDRSWTKRQDQAAKQYLKKLDAEELIEQNKKLKMVETVMMDQLSRAVISDPEQNVKGQIAAVGRRPRGNYRALHDTKVRTAASSTENLLSQRVRFGARVLTRNGHDAIRELTGFFFSVDNTLTIYEFRQFGKSSKALPFVNRGRFLHLRGPREGKPYSLPDICAGNDLVLSTSGQQSLPETLKRAPQVTFRVTDVDEEEKRRILLRDVPSNATEETYKSLHIPNKQEHTEKMILKSIQSNVQKKIKKRTIKTVTGLGQFYRKTDSSGKGVLYRFELEKGLFDFHIDLPPDVLDKLFEILDPDEKGELDYGVYMWAVLGNMIEARKSLVRKAFRKIDAGKKGYLTLSDIHKFFNSTFRLHKDSRDSVETGPLQAFLDAVLPSKRKEEVSYAEFEEYYEGLSLSVDDDEDFYNILRNTWTL